LKVGLTFLRTLVVVTLLNFNRVYLGRLFQADISMGL
jgi:hypothetical protein